MVDTEHHASRLLALALRALEEGKTETAEELTARALDLLEKEKASGISTSSGAVPQRIAQQQQQPQPDDDETNLIRNPKNRTYVSVGAPQVNACWLFLGVARP